MVEKGSLGASVTVALPALRKQPDTQRYIFLNPDGTRSKGLHILGEAAIGVEYATQSGGLTNQVRSAEGFHIRLGDGKERRSP